MLSIALKTSIKYGIVAGLLSGIIFYSEFFSGASEKSSGLISLGSSALLLIIFIFIYLRKIASPELNGFYTFGYGFKNAMMVVAASAVILAVFIFIFFKFINPGYIESLVAEGIKQMRNSGAGESEIQIAAENFRIMHSPFFEAVKSMIRTVLMGAFFSVIISLVVKRAKPPRPPKGGSLLCTIPPACMMVFSSVLCT